LKNRTTQALVGGVSLLGIDFLEEWGVLGYFKLNDDDPTIYHSLYILLSYRGKGKYSQWLLENPSKVVITQPECNISAFLARRGHPYRVLQPPVADWPEYRLVRSFYGDHCASRTGLHFINHIDEGLYILKEINASEHAMRAYILHPLLQADSDFRDFVEMCDSNKNCLSSCIHPTVLLLAIEYRSVANEYLSYKPSSDIRLSPVKDVNDMLIADKVQNRKDFELYHSQHHDRRERLTSYFSEWLSALHISESKYLELKAKLISRVHGAHEPEQIAKDEIVTFLAHRR
jgi:hypothetical protein